MLETFSVCVTTDGDDVPVVKLRGVVDIVTVGALADCLSSLVSRGRDKLILDLAKTSFIDARGIGVIAETRRKLGTGGQLILRHPQGVVHRVLEITGMDAHCIIVEDGGSPPAPI